MKQLKPSEVRLTNVRLAFPSLDKPTKFAGDQGDPKYSATLLIPKDDPQLQAVRQAINHVAKERWGERAGTVMQAAKAADKVCFRDGDLKEWEGFAGNVHIKATNKGAPTILDTNGKEIPADNGKIYAGCYVHVKLEFWAFDIPAAKGISATLKGVMFAKDGDAFAGSAKATPEDFDDLRTDDVGTDSEDIASLL